MVSFLRKVWLTYKMREVNVSVELYLFTVE
jgi:hypothetical protein